MYIPNYSFEPADALLPPLGEAPELEKIYIEDGQVSVENTAGLYPEEMASLVYGAMGCRIKEIARLTGLSKNMVSTHRHRGVRRLEASFLEDAIARMFEIETFVVDVPVNVKPMSPTYMEILGLYAEGYTYPQIQTILNPAVPHHAFPNFKADMITETPRRKLGASSRPHAVFLGFTAKILPAPSTDISAA